MATEVARLRAYLDADTDRFDRAIRGADSHFSKFGHAIKVGALAAGAAIGTGLAIAAKAGFDEFREGERVAAQTRAVLRSTGGVANVTAKRIDTLATSLMNMSGVDDEAIKSSENLLLTFTNIRNTNTDKIFDNATRAVLDMSVAMGQDLKTSTIQIGKALNDPISGLTSLARVGVKFTDQTKEQIKTLVEHGKTVEAQKMILHELSTEFAGSAYEAGKTFDGQMNILKETFRNTAGEIVGNFMPLIVELAKTILPLVAKGLEFVAGWIKKFGDAAQRHGNEVRGVFEHIWAFIQEHVVPILKRLRDIAVATFNHFKQVIEDNQPALKRIAERLGHLVDFLAKVLLPIIKLVFQKVLPNVLNAAILIIDKVSFAIEKVVDWVKRAYNWIKDKLGSQAVKNAINDLTGPFTAVYNIVKSIVDAVKWLIDNLPSIHLPGMSPNPHPQAGPGSSGGRTPPERTFTPRVATAGTPSFELYIDGERLDYVLRQRRERHERRGGL